MCSVGDVGVGLSAGAIRLLVTIEKFYLGRHRPVHHLLGRRLRGQKARAALPLWPALRRALPAPPPSYCREPCAPFLLPPGSSLHAAMQLSGLLSHLLHKCFLLVRRRDEVGIWLRCLHASL